MELTFTARNVLIGATLLGALGGTLGSFALLRRQSLLGDALAHAALPGVCIAYLITGTKSPLPLFAGALVAGLIGSLLILATVRWSRIKEDSAIGIVLSVFFGVGIVLLTFIQKLPAGNQSGLDKYLFGQAATLVEDDLKVMAVLGAVVVAFVVAFYKEFKLLSFDPGFGSSLGLPMRRLEVLLTLLLVVVVVVGLQTVGVVLIVATLITPAAAARQWTDRLGAMLLLSAGIGAASGAVGSLASASLSRLPTGPVIVLVSSSVLIVSLLLAPQRGILWARVRERQAAERIRRENLLKDLYLLGERKADWATALTWPHLMGVRGQTGRELSRSARPLIADGLAEQIGDTLRLTPAGRKEAEQVVRKHRIWEVYLNRRLELPSDHVHRDAEAMEHTLSELAVAELEEALGFPESDPHGSPIPPRRSQRAAS
ncbi:MAG TPA: iron chelate uptake ABC transporter family permease subunit [Thermoanaerobaculia bacterium]|nr:iron chelate uptake ABC transporter family permease subunit [Thermoanaerobaculia bacterium]